MWLFYVGFEAMIVPLALLIAVWGGPNRARASIRFVIYTLVGSLLMLVAIITLGLRAGSFDLAHVGTSNSRWLFLAFMFAFAFALALGSFTLTWVPFALAFISFVLTFTLVSEMQMYFIVPAVPSSQYVDHHAAFEVVSYTI